MDDATMLHGPVEGPINAVSLNREGTSIVVAGKNLLKVVSCKEEAPFKELASLKLGKVSTVNISHLDVSWCPVDGDNLIASAVTNGAIALWNLGLQSHRKLDRMFHVHRRTANKVCFHPSDANYLVSGSQDATVVFFDLRKSDPALAFENGTDCVRDIKFARSSQLMFALVDETGSVKFWDIRMPDRPVKLFTAHSGPIFSLDFHPSWRGTMATAGRDKLIKVWNWQIDRPSVLHTVQTIAPVSLIRWRRGREYHIASGSLVLDFSIHVWDVRRPYVPFVSFEGHTGAVTGICWKQDPHKLITSGRDGLLFLRDIKDAARFTDLISPATVAVSCRGEMIAAVSNTALQRSEAKSHSNILGKFGTIATMYKTKGFQAGIREKPTVLLREPHLSSVFVFSQISLDSSVQNVLAQNYASSASREVIVLQDFSCEYIADCAKRYKLQGGPVDQLCSHNSQEAYAWLLLSDIHTSGYLSPENVRRFQRAQKRTEAADEPDSDLSSDFSSENCTDENDVNELLESCSPQCTSRNSCSRDDHFDLWYSWAPRISPAFRSTVGSYDVPKDAFEDTSELKMQEESENVPKLLIPLLEDDFAAVFHELISNRKQKSVCRYVVADPSDFVFLISCMLNYYVEKASDVQMSVTMLIVLGETANGIVSESAVKRWFLAYIVTAMFKVYTFAALVVYTVVTLLTLKNGLAFMTFARQGVDILANTVKNSGSVFILAKLNSEQCLTRNKLWLKLYEPPFVKLNESVKQPRVVGRNVAAESGFLSETSTSNESSDSGGSYELTMTRIATPASQPEYITTFFVSPECVEFVTAWRPIDDFCLIASVVHYCNIELAYRFSRLRRSFTLEEVQSRWEELYSNGVALEQRREEIANLSDEQIFPELLRLQMNPAEAAALAEVSSTTATDAEFFRDLLEKKAKVFHEFREPAALLEFWTDLKRANLLCDQKINPAPTGKVVLSLSDCSDDGSDQAVGSSSSEHSSNSDDDSSSEDGFEGPLCKLARFQNAATALKQEINIIKEHIRGLVTALELSPETEGFGDSMVACSVVLHIGMKTYHLRSPVVIIGTPLADRHIDIDLSPFMASEYLEQYAGPLAEIEKRASGIYCLTNCSHVPIFVNGDTLLFGKTVALFDQSIIWIAGIVTRFELNGCTVC
ncbi:hypothetical protein M514_13073 [Trichuris suis]|uniref:GATOR2 complex protein WDR24 n=1 Tax=Trichuris suis TaxID=68888 RepID=A0A085NQL5_9BILA|nr:hypothetical protein M514_13073 [Trichuris suis]